MALFSKKRPVQNHQSDLKTLTARAELLETERLACVTALDAAIAARQLHLLEGDIADKRTNEILQGKVETARSALAGFESCHCGIEARINTAQRALSDELGRIKWEADAAALVAVVAGLEAKLSPWLESTRAISADLKSLNGFRWQPAPLAAFFQAGRWRRRNCAAAGS